MSPCVGEPVSYLRLELHQLGELPAAEARAIEAHLHACDACRACQAEVQREVTLPALRPLPETERAGGGRVLPQRPRAGLRWALGGGLAAAAALLLVLRLGGPGMEPPSVPPARVGVKGGELALTLVRRHGQALADPARFAPGDAFRALLTCPPGQPVRALLVVYQDGRAHFPLPPTRIASCGNQRPLDGAFSLDGVQEALVCVAVGAELPPRAELARGPEALPAGSVCRRISPGPGESTP
jgi:hypothetical protein